jgi:hypothetical protein
MLKVYGLNQRLAAMWSDFQAADWKFPELPPRAILKTIHFDKRWLDNFELRRAQWLWERRPALMLGEDWRAYALVIIIALSLFLVPVWGAALSGCWIMITFTGIFRDIVRLSRWRRDYESSIARLIRNLED